MAGGANGPAASTEFYDRVANTWSSAGTLTYPRAFHTATLLPNGKVLVAGGTSSGLAGVAASEIYDPAANSWSVAANLISPRWSHAAALLINGTVMVAGGYDITPTSAPISAPEWDSAEIYDPVADKWSATGSMSTARASTNATVLANGAVLVEGGQTFVICGGSQTCPGPVEYHSKTTASAELYWP